MRLFSLLLLLLWLSACLGGQTGSAVPAAPLTAVPTVVPTAAAAPATIAPTAPPSPTPRPADTGWLPIAAGWDERRVPVFADDGSGRLIETLHLHRLDPAVYTFDVAYRPGDPLLLRGWLAETNAVLVVNGGYFDERNRATGLIIAAGEPSGVSYGPFAGMMAVPVPGEIELRWLSTAPYDPNEDLHAAVQSFPILVKPGGVLGFPATADNGRTARRTAIGRDADGRIVLIAAPRGGLTLHAFSRALTENDLALDFAFNLDGGSSTGLLWRPPGSAVESGYLPLVPLPAVITVSPAD